MHYYMYKTPVSYIGLVAILMLTLSGCFISQRDSYSGGNNNGQTQPSSQDCVRNRDQRFGKGDGVPCHQQDIASIPDAVPKWEPKSRSGNPKSYVIQGKRYYVMDSAEGYSATGTASWYGQKFHGRKTSSGEIYDVYGMTAAHTSLPLPTYARVTRLGNGPYAGRSIVVKINDRGPFIDSRLIDLSYAAAVKLGVVSSGIAPVRVEAINTSPNYAARGNSIANTASPPRVQTASRPAPVVLTDAQRSAAITAYSDSEKSAVIQPAPTTLPRGFYLQLGAYSQKQTAKKVHAAVDSYNPMRTYVETYKPRNPNQNTLHRILVGEFISRSDALQWQDYFADLGYRDITVVSR